MKLGVLKFWWLMSIPCFMGFAQDDKLSIQTEQSLDETTSKNVAQAATIISFDTDPIHVKDAKIFLEDFVPRIASKAEDCGKLSWLLETTGSQDAADVKAKLDVELKMLFSDEKTYQKLLVWDKKIQEPLYHRQVELLFRAFKENMVPKELMIEIASLEADISQRYANFRVELNGKIWGESDIVEALKKETDVAKRKEVWAASKEIGNVLAPIVIEVVKLRNKAAQKLGYSNFFQMQLALQEIDEKWLLDLFDDVSKRSEAAYNKTIDEINNQLAQRFNVKKEELGPWAWCDTFCQEDPLANHEFDSLLEGVDILEVAKRFYKDFGFDITNILASSDFYERKGKNQHAFCININRYKKDVRVLNNIRPQIRWLDTTLHEFGHGIYELGYDETLPWLLQEPPHVFLTEAIALLCGRQAYNPLLWKDLISVQKDKEFLVAKLSQSLKRKQLIFSRFVFMMTHFESELYKNPDQDLNKLWWQLVEKYQKIKTPIDRDNRNDWSTKFHIAMAPVYYHSYLLGEFLASALWEKMALTEKFLWNPINGNFLKQQLFYLGSSFNWDTTVKKVLGYPLNGDAWIKEFAQ